MTPNQDVMDHQWVGTLAWFNFELEYQKWSDNTVADALSWFTTWMDLDTVKSILNGVTLGTTHWAEVHNPAIVKGNHHLEQEVHVTVGHTLLQMHVTDWAEDQEEDLMLSTVLDWMKAWKKKDLKALLAEHTSSKEGRLILGNWQNFTIHQGALYLCSTPKGETEDLLLFVVPRGHHVTILNGCHRDVGHQGHDHTLSLLREYFWWPSMAKRQKGWLARTSGWNSACLQCHLICCDGVQSTLFNVWMQAKAPSQLLLYFLTFRSEEVPKRGPSAKCVDEYVATVWDWLRLPSKRPRHSQWQKPNDRNDTMTRK